ncbi:hypothetical protein D020_1503 [Vibrio parahaemolyticus SBR10290]|nr:conserved hypothetical protein [Vibrio parahaemolyticus Peru-466]EFO40733.1 conserved hypothetical protein [Vibrio parahaemolyticus AN-5034]EQM12471.1 hypothetical protein D024_1817 [Vibrio parahaemolyticus 3259]ESV69241.1 hypothetical protein D021_1692 [Vibrio parahaemolyticus 10296]ESW44845.1 hypothetical protein D022_1674 [Vibrio parahaemolyticus 12310]ETJ91902.1 hypothetical protein D041_1933 [Vibrio parahaemolyticus EKP-008]ETS23235.1 hypothetical protein D033_1120 [Vibrio parahaemoly
MLQVPIKAFGTFSQPYVLYWHYIFMTFTFQTSFFYSTNQVLES